MRRKLALAAVLVLACMLIASCGSSKLVGTWSETTGILGFSVETTITFNKDGTGSWGGVAGLSSSFTYAVNKDKVSINGIEYVFKVKGGELTLTDASGKATVYKKK